MTMFPRLQGAPAQLAGGLSGGEQQMLAIGRGLMARPRLILFDEPSLGLSPMLTKFVLALDRGIAQRGIATLLVEQNMRAALQDRRSRLRPAGRPHRSRRARRSEIANAADIQEAYLGV